MLHCSGTMSMLLPQMHRGKEWVVTSMLHGITEIVYFIYLTHSTRRATIVAHAQSSRNSEGHYSGRGNVINVINLKLIPSWAFPRTRNIPSGMS